MQPEEWEAFCRAYPNLLHPIYKLQRTLQVRKGGCNAPSTYNRRAASCTGRAVCVRDCILYPPPALQLSPQPLLSLRCCSKKA